MEIPGIQAPAIQQTTPASTEKPKKDCPVSATVANNKDGLPVLYISNADKTCPIDYRLSESERLLAMEKAYKALGL